MRFFSHIKLFRLIPSSFHWNRHWKQSGMGSGKSERVGNSGRYGKILQSSLVIHILACRSSLALAQPLFSHTHSVPLQLILPFYSEQFDLLVHRTAKHYFTSNATVEFRRLNISSSAVIFIAHKTIRKAPSLNFKVNVSWNSQPAYGTEEKKYHHFEIHRRNYTVSLDLKPSYGRGYVRWNHQLPLTMCVFAVKLANKLHRIHRLLNNTVDPVGSVLSSR